MKIQNSKVLGFLLLFLASTYASASDTSRGYLGGMIGADLPKGNAGSSVSPVYGGTLGVKLAPQFGLGVFGTYYSQNNSGSLFGLTAGTQTKTVNLAGELNFFASILHVGADVGTSINSWSAGVNNASLSTSNHSLIYGPEAGLDIPLFTTALTVGAEAHYLINNADNGQNNVLVMGAVKVWF